MLNTSGVLEDYDEPRLARIAAALAALAGDEAREASAVALPGSVIIDALLRSSSEACHVT